jgi:putative addiction module antidote
MREFSTNAYAIRDRKEGAAQTEQENATPTDFSKLNPVSPVGKGAAVVGEVGKAAGRVVEGLSGDDPGQYVRDTLAGKKKHPEALIPNFAPLPCILGVGITMVITLNPVEPSMTTLKLTQIGNSLGLILPREVLARLKLQKGDTVFVTDAANGVMLTPYDPDLDQQLEIGREFMHEYRDTFHQLAK